VIVVQVSVGCALFWEIVGFGLVLNRAQSCFMLSLNVANGGGCVGLVSMVFVVFRHLIQFGCAVVSPVLVERVVWGVMGFLFFGVCWILEAPLYCVFVELAAPYFSCGV